MPAAGAWTVGAAGRERAARLARLFVVNDGVVDDAHVHRVLQGDAASGEAATLSAMMLLKMSTR
jgi:hypothetical protein